VHRIGRTGRAGASGEAISLVCVDERAFLRGIERLIKRPIPEHVVKGFEPDRSARPQPVFAPRGRKPAERRNGAAAPAPWARRSGPPARKQATSGDRRRTKH
jgi:ATP-dependent RNA helicase RhlE